MKKEDIDQTKEGELEEVGATSIYDHQGVDMVDDAPQIWKPIQHDETGKIILPQIKFKRD